MSNESSTRKRTLIDLFSRGLISEADLEVALKAEADAPETKPPAEPQTMTGAETRPRRSSQGGPRRGDVLGGMFELVEPIGRGAMGVVWKARDTAGNRNVCVKLLPAEVQNDETELDRVRKMFEKVHSLTHEYLCPVYLLGNDPKHRAFLVMKLVEGVTLGSYFQSYAAKHKSIPVTQVARLLGMVAGALDYVHRQKVVHRDVKPANILVSTDGEEVSVVDLGLAAEIRSSVSRTSRSSRDLAGTAPYMAPEQWRGEAVDGQADQYALANIAYQFLADRLPFDCPNDTAWMHCALNQPIAPIDGQPDHVNAALAKGLAKDKSDRFATCTDFVRALQSPARPVAPVAKKTSKASPALGADEVAKTEPMELIFEEAVEVELTEPAELEEILADVMGNLFRGLEGVGGRLQITNRRLLFQPHSFNFQKAPLEIPLGDIASVTKRNTLGLIPNGLQVTTRSGVEYKFVVWDRENLIRIIESQRRPT